MKLKSFNPMVVMTLFLTFAFPQMLKAQDFELSPNTYDSLAPNDYLIGINGYALFTDSMVFHVELKTNDSSATSVYSGFYDFNNDTDALNGFVYDASTEEFRLTIGNYPTRNYLLRIWTEVLGVVGEELIIDINE